MIVLKIYALIFLFAFIHSPSSTNILRAQEQTTPDLCRQMIQSADENNETELKRIMTSNRGKSIDCITGLLDGLQPVARI